MNDFIEQILEAAAHQVIADCARGWSVPGRVLAACRFLDWVEGKRV